MHAAVRVASYKEVKNIMETYLTEMKNIDHLNLVDLDDRVFEAQYFYELEYYILNGEFKEAVALMPVVENELKKVEDIENRDAFEKFNILHWINKKAIKHSKKVIIRNRK